MGFYPHSPGQVPDQIFIGLSVYRRGLDLDFQMSVGQTLYRVDLAAGFDLADNDHVGDQGRAVVSAGMRKVSEKFL